MRPFRSKSLIVRHKYGFNLYRIKILSLSFSLYISYNHLTLTNEKRPTNQPHYVGPLFAGEGSRSRRNCYQPYSLPNNLVLNSNPTNSPKVYNLYRISFKKKLYFQVRILRDRYLLILYESYRLFLYFVSISKCNCGLTATLHYNPNSKISMWREQVWYSHINLET